jgi:hypothetical protein
VHPAPQTPTLGDTTRLFGGPDPADRVTALSPQASRGPNYQGTGASRQARGAASLVIGPSPLWQSAAAHLHVRPGDRRHRNARSIRRTTAPGPKVDSRGRGVLFMKKDVSKALGEVSFLEKGGPVSWKREALPARHGTKAARPTTGSRCTHVEHLGRRYTVTVTLDEPLGARTVRTDSGQEVCAAAF